MSTIKEDLAEIKEIEDKIIANKVANFAYTDEAYTKNDANGVTEYNVNKAQNIPTADPSVLKVNDTVLSQGYRTQASSITRMLMNHFLGRLSYNVNKVNDNFNSLLVKLDEKLGTANGIATLDNQGRIPYSQVPESAILANVYPYIYTGRNLVEVFGVSTAVQAFAKLREKSDAGDFSGLGIGDYINIPSLDLGGDPFSPNIISYNGAYENLRAEIVAFDQYYRNGDTDITAHHIIMQMKNCPFTHRINSTNTNEGGYGASELKTYLSSTVVGAIEASIEISLKTIRRLLSTHGSWDWLAEKCFLPSEVECIGTKAWSDNYGYTVGNSRQWAMFQLRPDRLIKFYNGAKRWWWTCSDSTSDSTGFVHVDRFGYISGGTASNDYGVPFAFAI